MPLILVLSFLVLQVAKRDRCTAWERRVQLVPFAHLAALRAVESVGFFPETALPHDLGIGSTEDDATESAIVDAS
jgi:hypothetical protein